MLMKKGCKSIGIKMARLMLLITVMMLSAGLQAAERSGSWTAHREDVRMVQKYLQKEGYDPGSADGLMGPQTKEAILAYQREKGLETNGKITEELVAQLLIHINVPEDFFISYSSGPAHMDWGRGIEVTVNGDGDYLLTRTMRRERGKKETLSKGRLSSARIKMLFAQAMSCNVFKLKKRYANNRIMDGSVENLQITADGKSHSVSVANTYVGGVSCIAMILKGGIPGAKKYIR